MIITTSWDDGDALDTRVAGMLDRHGIKGTFYIARDERRPRISDNAIRDIATRHEIGAHTLTHPDLTTLSREEKVAEIAGSKQWLEHITGKEVPLFCYPGGKFDDETVDVVRESGFRGARTTKHSLGRTIDPFRFGVSLTFYPNHFSRTDRVLSWYRRIVEPMAALPAFLAGETWQRRPLLENYVFAQLEAARPHGIFHLYGHSWANTRFGLWPVLERVLSRLSREKDAEFLTNGEALARLRYHV